MKYLFVTGMILMGLSLSVHAQHQLQSEPFFGIDLTRLPPSSRTAIEEASEDFRLALAGRRPVHARVDTEAALPADGGTTFYIGTGYQMTIVQRIVSLRGREEQAPVSGYWYGPIITLDKEVLLAGEEGTISTVRFYTPEQLRQLQQP